MARRLILLLAGSLALSAAVPAAGTAYYFHGVLWPGGIVRYFNAAPDQSWAVAQAVRAWNHSGAHVRFIAVPRASAQMVIEEPGNKVYCSEAYASVGYAREARVVIFPAHGVTHACNPYWAARVMTHEFGHILGLVHEDRYCTTMNSTGSMRGGSQCPQLLWAWRCRLLEPDDIAGVAAEYGGKPRRPTMPEYCPLYPAIARPGTPSATLTGAGSAVTLRFRRPASARIPAFVVPSPWRGHDGFVMSLPMPNCEAATATVPDYPRYRWSVPVGAFQTIHVVQPSTHACMAVWALDRLGRPGPPDTFVIAH